MVSSIARTLSVVVLLVLCFAPYTVHGQGSGGLDLERLFQSNKAPTSMSALLQGEQMPTDNVVNAKAYVIGPGDVLAYQSSGLDFSEKLIVVGPENTILLERIGLISVEGLTLAAVRDTITAVVQRRNSGAQVYVALRRARLVYVRVSGNVSYPGMYAVPASMKVSTLLALIRQPWLLRKDPAASETARLDRSQSDMARLSSATRGVPNTLSAYAMRNTVVRNRQTTRLVDLVKAQVEGFEYLDPHVREEDHITVPFDFPDAATISIGGAVNSPATIVWKEGDDVAVLLAAGGGLASVADRSTARVIDGLTGNSKSIAIGADDVIVAGREVLQPGSMVVVDAKPVREMRNETGLIEIVGEVQRPGSVFVIAGKTSLVQAIEQAGGFTNRAALNLAYIVRQQPTQESDQQASEIFRRFQFSDLKLEDTVRYRLDQTFRLPFVSCDVSAAFRDTNSSHNVRLLPGDRIIVPSAPSEVFVYGQVANPGLVRFENGKSLEWYVEHAGGFAAGARPGRARIIRGRTKVWVEPDEPGIFVEPGDEVYVPRSPDMPIGTDIQYYAVIGGVLSSVAALASVLFTILR